MSMQTFQFSTDTATMCVFDPAAMKHRLQDDADWWSIPDEELAEVNSGNVAFLNLGADGVFTIEVVQERCRDGVTVLLRCPSGRLFLGAGEEVTSDGLEPEGIRGGGFLELAQGNYEISAARDGLQVRIHLERVEAVDVSNSFERLLRI